MLRAQALHERLSKTVALGVFSSDALSSVAYATEEILLVLILAGATATRLALPVALAIAGLLAVVTLSYQQTIHAYPNGGGSYIVARANLGVTAGLVAAAALMVDYVLTVAVSVAAGVAAITSAWPALTGHRLFLGVTCIAAIGLVNLRRVREAGRTFALPTYLFIGSLAGVIAVGFFRIARGQPLELGTPPGPAGSSDTSPAVKSPSRPKRLPISKAANTDSMFSRSMAAFDCATWSAEIRLKTSTKLGAASPARSRRRTVSALSRKSAMSGPPASREAPAPRMKTVLLIGGRWWWWPMAAGTPSTRPC